VLKDELGFYKLLQEMQFDLRISFRYLLSRSQETRLMASVQRSRVETRLIASVQGSRVKNLFAYSFDLLSDDLLLLNNCTKGRVYLADSGKGV